MKIVVVQDHLRSGGTERQSVLLTGGFAAAGHAVTLLTFRPGGALAATVAPGVRWTVLQPFDSRADWWAPRLRTTVRALAPTVVLCMGRMANCYGAALQSATPAAAVIATLRTGKPLPWLFRRSLRRVRHVVANSNQAAAVAARHASRVSVIHNSLVFSAGAPDPDARERLRRAHGAGAATTVLLNVAMFRPEKNQRALIAMARLLPADLDWQLWLAGDGPERARCVDEVQRAGLGERIRFLGWLEDPRAAYAAADLAVHASRREALSNFLIEAQAHALPVVAWDALGVTETFVPDVSGRLVPPENVPALRDAALALITDPARRRQMGAAGAAQARERFSPARQVQAYLDLFQQLATTPGP